MLRRLRMRNRGEADVQNDMHRSHAVQDGIRYLQSRRPRIPGVPGQMPLLLGPVHLHETVAGRLPPAAGSFPLPGVQRGGREGAEQEPHEGGGAGHREDTAGVRAAGSCQWGKFKDICAIEQ